MLQKNPSSEGGKVLQNLGQTGPYVMRTDSFGGYVRGVSESRILNRSIGVCLPCPHTKSAASLTASERRSGPPNVTDKLSHLSQTRPCILSRLSENGDFS